MHSKLVYILYSERELDHEFHYIHLHMHASKALFRFSSPIGSFYRIGI